MKALTVFPLLLCLANLSAGAQTVDENTGLLVAPGWELVRANCTSCHSARLITQQRGGAAHWRSIIEWMQKTQNLWPLDPDIEAAIIQYLATAYPPAPGSRRPPIPDELLPPSAAAVHRD